MQENVVATEKLVYYIPAKPHVVVNLIKNL